MIILQLLAVAKDNIVIIKKIRCDKIAAANGCSRIMMMILVVKQKIRCDNIAATGSCSRMHNLQDEVSPYLLSIRMFITYLWGIFSSNVHILIGMVTMVITTVTISMNTISMKAIVQFMVLVLRHSGTPETPNGLNFEDSGSPGPALPRLLIPTK